MLGAPQHTMPQGGGIPGEKGYSGVIPDAAANVTASGLPMIQRRPAMALGTLLAAMRSSCVAVLLASHAHTVSRVRATWFCAPESMRISTYCTFGSPPAPDITSSMRARWNAAGVGEVTRRTSIDARAAAARIMCRYASEGRLELSMRKMA